MRYQRCGRWVLKLVHLFKQCVRNIEHRSESARRAGTGSCRRVPVAGPHAALPLNAEADRGRQDQDRYFEILGSQIRAMRDAGKSLDEIKKGIRAELGEFAQWPRERAIPATAEQVYRELPAR